MRMRRSVRILAVLGAVGLSAGLAACASGSGGPAGPRRNANLITAEEMADYAFPTVLDAIRRLRPRWLQPRAGSGSPQAILDGTRLGGLDQLRVIDVADIVSIRFLSASDATTRYGTGFPAGAIEVSTR